MLSSFAVPEDTAAAVAVAGWSSGGTAVALSWSLLLVVVQVCRAAALLLLLWWWLKGVAVDIWAVGIPLAVRSFPAAGPLEQEHSWGRAAE